MKLTVRMRRTAGDGNLQLAAPRISRLELPLNTACANEIYNICNFMMLLRTDLKGHRKA
jgi:hypothetical protein